MTSQLNDSLRPFIGSLTRRTGASSSALLTLRQLAPALPNDYLSFLSFSNGAEGPIGAKNYLVLWAVEDLMDSNTGYGVDDFVPGLLLIGTDGANTGYGYDCRSNPPQLVEVPLAGLDWSDATVMAPDFSMFLKRLFEGM